MKTKKQKVMIGIWVAFCLIIITLIVVFAVGQGNIKKPIETEASTGISVETTGPIIPEIPPSQGTDSTMRGTSLVIDVGEVTRRKDPHVVDVTVIAESTEGVSE